MYTIVKGFVYILMYVCMITSVCLVMLTLSVMYQLSKCYGTVSGEIFLEKVFRGWI